MIYKCTGLLLPALLLALLTGCASTPALDEEAQRQRLHQAAKTNVQLGIEYMREGDMEMSLNKFEKALELNANDVKALRNRARAYQKLGLEDKANADLELIKQLSIQ